MLLRITLDRMIASSSPSVILKESDGFWRAFQCTDSEASVEDIAQVIVDRWAIEQVQLRRVWSNVGALNLNLWVHSLIEV